MPLTDLVLLLDLCVRECNMPCMLARAETLARTLCDEIGGDFHMYHVWLLEAILTPEIRRSSSQGKRRQQTTSSPRRKRFRCPLPTWIVRCVVDVCIREHQTSWGSLPKDLHCYTASCPDSPHVYYFYNMILIFYLTIGRTMDCSCLFPAKSSPF